MSVEIKPDGAIKIEQIHTPIAQMMDMSRDERRLTILTIKGMFQKGMTIAATRPMCSMIFMKSLAYRKNSL